jgi:hypothetical protein
MSTNWTMSQKVAYLVCGHNASNAIWIPEQLVYIIVTNNAIVITFSSLKLAINRLIALVTNEAVKVFNNRAKARPSEMGSMRFWHSGER